MQLCKWLLSAAYVFPIILQKDGNGYCLSHRLRLFRTVPELEKPRVHDLRHEYAMLALSAGNSMDAIADHPGHCSADFTRKVYSSFSHEQKQRDAAAMDELIRGIS